MAEAPPGILVDVVMAWPRRHVHRTVFLPDGATVGEAVTRAGFDEATMASVAALAIHGERVAPDARLRDGDRLELLRPLQADPKDARRLRAQRQRRP